MGQRDEFACYMTQDAAQWRLPNSLSLSLVSPPSCEAGASFFFILLLLLAII